MSAMRRVSAFLIDLDGTVFQDDCVIPGVPEALAALREREIPFRFVSNMTSQPRRVLLSRLAAMGIEITPDWLFTPPMAARTALIARGLLRCHLLVAPETLVEFEGLQVDDSSPQAVVVGDAGPGFSYERMNRAFTHLLAGAELIALARNRMYRRDGGLLLDVGAYVAALEYATGKTATLVGKPSPAFFRLALDSMGADPSETAVVGDDLESDVGGAQSAGLLGVLVRTGKFRGEDLERSSIRPDAIVGSLSEIVGLLR